MTDVAVVIPVRNGAAYLAAAIESVLAQTHPPSEIVVVDDGSTDESGRIAASFDEVRVLTQEPSGQAAARNLGVASTNAELIAFLDADDVMPHDRLRAQVDALTDRPDAGGCVGHCVVFAGDLTEARDAAIPAQLAGALTARRATFDQIGMFDPTIIAGEYADWYLRARDADRPIIMTDGVVTLRRSHESNLTRDRERIASGYLQVAHLAIQRARAVEER